MKKSISTLCFLTIVWCLTPLWAINKTDIEHSISVSFDIPSSSLSVSDTLAFASTMEDYTFYLNKNLVITSQDASIRLIKSTDSLSSINTYTLTPTNNSYILTYSGVIKDGEESLLHPRHGQSANTTGIIFEKGIYLAGSSYWVPRFKTCDLMTFTLEATVDSTWDVVAQGQRLADITTDGKRTITYQSSHPTNQVYLTANQWHYSAMPAGDTKIESFLITEDKALARKYMGTTAGYLKLYEDRIGPYPYSKFSLVENFWETGYGMPSFTLLGQRVIRMPWILYSSYPHELLHNYWGNGVYVDYSKGNWSEGITVYMADHYFKEQKGEDASYRRTALQKFTTYVNAENDFPLAQFKTRTTQESSAIGYDKAMMMNHMLRVKYGDKVFNKAYAYFYDKHKFTIAGFDDIKASFEHQTGDDLEEFFTQWVQRTGAPELEITQPKLKKGGKRLTFDISQKQEGEAFTLLLPIALTYEDTVIVEKISITNKKASYTLDIPKHLKEVSFDPKFDVMRILNSSETPATISGLLGAQKLTIVLPSKDGNLEDYRQFAEMYKARKRTQQISIVNEQDYTSTDQSAALLVLGNSQTLRTLANPTVKALVSENENAENSTIYSIKNDKQQMTFLSSPRPNDLMNILMKVEHYGSFSYLSFDKENKVVVKEIFPVLNSSMTFNFNR